MYGATLLLLAIGVILTRTAAGANISTPPPITKTPTSVAPLSFTGWAPTCDGSNITIPTDASFAQYYAKIVTYPSNCSLKDDIHLTTNVIIPQNCIDQTTKTVVLSFQPKEINRAFIGGKNHTEVSITCSLGKDGVSATANVSIAVQPQTGTPQQFTATPPAPTLTMDLVEMTTGTDISTATSQTTVTLGQDKLYLKISDPVANQLLLPTKCSGVSSGPSKSTYVFFSAGTGTNTCAYDDEVLGMFNVSKPQVSYAQFYPFMFVSGESITLTCEVLVCPESPTGGKCQATQTSVNSCTAGSVTQTSTPVGRRRRSAREGQPDTHVVEVTYTVVGHDPALDGQTAAGAVMAVSIPLLAAVTSLWIL